MKAMMAASRSSDVPPNTSYLTILTKSPKNSQNFLSPKLGPRYIPEIEVRISMS